MGDPTPNQQAESRRLSDRKYRSQDSNRPFELPDFSRHAASDGAVHSDTNIKHSTPVRRPRTAHSGDAAFAQADGDSALGTQTGVGAAAFLRGTANTRLEGDGQREIDDTAVPNPDYYRIGDGEDVHRVERLPMPFDGLSSRNEQLPSRFSQAATLMGATTVFNEANIPPPPPYPPLPPPPPEDSYYNATPSQHVTESETNPQVITRPSQDDTMSGELPGQAPEHEDWIYLRDERDTSPPEVYYDASPPAVAPAPPPETQEYEIPDPFATEPPGEVFPKWDDPVPDPFHSPEEDAAVQYVEPEPVQPDTQPVLDQTAPIPSPNVTDGTTDVSIPRDVSPARGVFPLESRGTHDAAPGTGAGFSKTLKNLQKNIDVILEKRTKWQNEQLNLERLREFYHKSMRGMIAALRERSSGASQDGHKDDKTTESERRRKGKSRHGLRVSSSSGRESRAATTSSSKGIAETPVSRTTSTSFSNFEAAQERFEEDEKALVDQEEKMKGLVEEINILEYRIKELADEARRQMRSANFVDDLKIELLNMETMSQDSEPKPQTKRETPDLVRQYFEWTGERGISLERLQELDFNHQEGLVQRDFLRDQGHDLDVPDDVYLRNYLSHREDITTKLDEAKYKIAFLLNLCEENGLNPELYRKAPRTQYSGLSPPRSANIDPDQIEELRPGVVERQRSMSPLGEGHRLRIINNWLLGVPQSDPVMSSGPIFESTTNNPP